MSKSKTKTDDCTSHVIQESDTVDMISPGRLLEHWVNRKERLTGGSDDGPTHKGLSQSAKADAVSLFLRVIDAIQAASSERSQTQQQNQHHTEHQTAPQVGLQTEVELQTETDIKLQSAALSARALNEGVSAEIYLADLFCCQLSLLEILSASAREGTGGYPDLTACHVALNQIVEDCVGRYHSRVQSESGSTTKQAHEKTLQHEIRTPLQAALLTCELVIEDIGSQDTSLLTDMHTVRQSIEGAIRIVNEFSDAG